MEFIEDGMHIIFDNIAFSNQRFGGISVVWYELESRFLGSQKDNITLLEYKNGDKNAFRRKLDVSNANIIKKHHYCQFITRYLNPSFKCNTPFVFQSTYYRLCKNKMAANVTVVHDFTYDYFYKGKRKGAFLHLWQRNRAIRESAAVVCISENTKRDLLKFLPDVNPNKVYVIYNGVSEDYHVGGNKIENLQDSILFVGGREAYKNGRWFADAIRDTNYKVVFCGGKMSEEEKTYYDNVLGAERYEVKVGLSNTELNNYYNSVKCLVYPSSYEGFGIPVLEAQRAGCPVIALNASSIPEIIGETPLLLQELKKEELLHKLSILENSVQRNIIVESGLKNSMNYSWDKAYKQYRDLYKQLL